MRNNILIVKPNNNIYLRTREDNTKTDLQSGEILAFANALITESFQLGNELNVHFANDMETCINNNMGIAQNRRQFGEDPFNPWIKQFHLYGNPDFEKSLRSQNIDTVVIFCGMFTEDDQKTQDLINLVKTFEGRIFYVLNDLRLGIPPKYKDIFVNAEVTILTQAYKWTDSELPVKQMEFDKLPFWYVDYDKDVQKTYDICYPVLNIHDVGEGRLNKLKKLSKLKDVNKLWIGLNGYNFARSTGFDGGHNNQTYPVVKYNDIGRVTKMCNSSYIVNEDIYNESDLIPNRLWECLIVGCIPLFDRETYWATTQNMPAEVYNELGLSMTVINDEFDGVNGLVGNPSLLWFFQGIGQKLRMNSELRINTLRNFNAQINKFLREDEY